MSKLRFERRFKADAKTVFDFVTRSENLAKWWGPEGMNLPAMNIDLTRKGPWSSTMQAGNGQKFTVSGKVLTVDPPHQVEFTWGWHDEAGKRGHESRVQFSVRPDPSGGAIFTLVHSGLEDADSAANHNEGWTSSLRKLERMDA
jgi:uncharacterized protein YndB with AHSA1/START domain